MKKLITIIIFTSLLCLSKAGFADMCKQVIYYDSNGDGNIDYEVHKFPCMSDADWELIDEDKDGRYDLRVVYGIGISKERVNIAVPKIVKPEEE